MKYFILEVILLSFFFTFVLFDLIREDIEYDFILFFEDQKGENLKWLVNDLEII